MIAYENLKKTEDSKSTKGEAKKSKDAVLLSFKRMQI